MSKHILLTRDTCPQRGDPEHDHGERCPVCDHGLGVCSLCGKAEAELADPCPGAPERKAVRLTASEMLRAEAARQRQYRDGAVGWMERAIYDHAADVLDQMAGEVERATAPPLTDAQVDEILGPDCDCDRCASDPFRKQNRREQARKAMEVRP